LEILTPLQKEILSKFASVPESDLLYLTGGTALAAFYLQHRKSNDLDFFTDKVDILSPFSFRLEKALQNKGMAVERSRSLHSFVELLVKKGEASTIIHLAQDAPFRFEPTKEFPEFKGLRIDNLKDIASNTLLALFQRATLRDFIDIYILIKKKHFVADQLIKLAKEKDPGFDLYWLGVAFERINLFSVDAPDMLLLINPCSLEELLVFFNDWRERIAKELAK
jgi:predicted nucleotidyltransferase component of viral defense system